MGTALRLLIEIALFAAAVFIVFRLRRSTAAKTVRLGIAVSAALVLAGVGYVLATQFGWTPVGKASDSVARSPQLFFAFQALSCILGFVLVALIRPKPTR